MAQDPLANKVHDTRSGLLGSLQAAQLRARALQANPNIDINIFDPVVDALWGAFVGEYSKAPNNYFDYYFSGQDVGVFIGGLEDDLNFKNLPLVSIGYNIQQQKQPVYGFWSYTYDGVMRGTRLVNGQFTLATRSPDYMRQLLSNAAVKRSQSHNNASFIRPLTNDDVNIQKYWGKNIDPTLSQQEKQIFSVHPPFNFVILYGVQTVSMAPNTYSATELMFLSKYRQDTAMFSDINERVVDSDPLSQGNRIILDACELTDMSTGYGPDGSVVSETYSFIARDLIIPAVGAVGTAPNSSTSGIQAQAVLPAVPRDIDAQHQHLAGAAVPGGFADLPPGTPPIPPTADTHVGNARQFILVGALPTTFVPSDGYQWAGPGWWGIGTNGNVHRWFYNVNWKNIGSDGNWSVTWVPVDMGRRPDLPTDGFGPLPQAIVLDNGRVR